MMVSNRGSVFRLLFWQWKLATLFVVAGLSATAAHELLELRWLALPPLPLGVAGGALGIFVSFRTNSAYARWWEGRQLWGKLVNASRMFSSQAVAYLERADAPGVASALARELVTRHVGYVHWLRCALRDQRPHEDPDVVRLLGAELEGLGAEPNVGHALLHRQLVALARAERRGELDAMRLTSMDQTIASLLDVQGGCERIKRTPMPRGYSFIAERLVMGYAFVFPLGVVRDLGWGTPLLSTFVCLAFALIGEAGRVLEDPFTLFWNGLPLSALSTTIESNARARLGDAELPPPKVVDEHGILM